MTSRLFAKLGKSLVAEKDLLHHLLRRVGVGTVNSIHLKLLGVVEKQLPRIHLRRRLFALDFKMAQQVQVEFEDVVEICEQRFHLFFRDEVTLCLCSLF